MKYITCDVKDCPLPHNTVDDDVDHLLKLLSDQTTNPADRYNQLTRFVSDGHNSPYITDVMKHPTFLTDYIAENISYRPRLRAQYALQRRFGLSSKLLRTRARSLNEVLLEYEKTGESFTRHDLERKLLRPVTPREWDKVVRFFTVTSISPEGATND